MPEAAAVLLVFFVCAFVYVMAKVKARDPALRAPAVQRVQLTEQRAWLEERLRQAEQENWSPEMRQPIAEELKATTRKLSEIGAA